MNGVLLTDYNFEPYLSGDNSQNQIQQQFINLKGEHRIGQIISFKYIH